MNKGVKMRFANYAKRFADPNVSLRQKWVSFWRYLGMALGLILEKVRGVDSAMIWHEDDGLPHCGNYTMSPRKVLKRVFNDIGDKDKKGFIDVGCGKGYAIKEALRVGFKVVGGVEYNRKLYDICIKNLRKENVPIDRVSHGMAQDYENYQDFDIFYFNNPFDEEILSEVLEKISINRKFKKSICYYLNPMESRVKAFEKHGFKLIRVIDNPSECYFKLNVYEK